MKISDTLIIIEKRFSKLLNNTRLVSVTLKVYGCKP